MKILPVLFLILLATGTTIAGEGRWKFVFSNGDTISEISIFHLEHDSVVLFYADHAVSFPVDSIVQIREPGSPNLWMGGSLGFVCGALIGGLIAYNSETEHWCSSGTLGGQCVSYSDYHSPDKTLAGALIGGTVGFVIGGSIGVATASERIYDMSAMTREAKLNTIFSIIGKSHQQGSGHDDR